jgi:hypothetical protein
VQTVITGGYPRAIADTHALLTEADIRGFDRDLRAAARM